MNRKGLRAEIKKISFRILRIFGWIWVSLVLLFLIVSLSIQIPLVQNKIVNKATNYLQGKLGTVVSIGHVSLSFPKKVRIDQIYVEDQQRDTLLYLGMVKLDADLFKLISKEIELDEIQLDHVAGKIFRGEDSLFNFDYILQSFSDPKQTKDTTSNGWDFSLKALSLHDIALVYHDSLENDRVDIGLKELELSLDNMNLEEQVYQVDGLYVEGLNSQILWGSESQKEPVSENPKKNSKPIVFSFNDFKMIDSKMSYYSHLGDSIKADIGSIVVAMNRINIENKVLDFSQVEISECTFKYSQDFDSLDTNKQAADANLGSDMLWKIKIKELLLDDNNMRYSNWSKAPLTRGVDFNHMDVSHLKIEADNIIFDETKSKIHLKELSFSEQAGFAIQTAHGELNLDSTRGRINDLLIRTKHSQIHIQGEFGYQSLSELSEDWNKLSLDVDLLDTQVSGRDVFFFQPHLLDSIPLRLSEATVSINGHIVGDLNNLFVEELELRTLEKTNLIMQGRLKGLPDIHLVYFDLKVNQFNTSHSDIASVLGDSLLPQAIRLPQAIHLEGDFQGTIYEPKIRASLTSSMGDLALIANTQYDSLTDVFQYQGEASVEDLQLGDFLGQKSMGAVNMKLSLAGSGLTWKEMDTQVGAAISSFEFKDYVYRDFMVAGHVENSVFTGKASMDDPNLAFTINGDMDYSHPGDKVPYHFVLNVENMDFKALHLTHRPLKARFSLSLDLENPDIHMLNGTMGLREVVIFNGQELYKVDSLLFISLADSSNSEMKITSDIVQGEFVGSFDILSLPNVLKEHFSYYYSSRSETDKLDLDFQNFTFSLDFKNTSILTDIFLPQLKEFQPEVMQGKFDSQSRELTLHFQVGSIIYGSTSTENLLISIESDQKSLRYDMSTESLTANLIEIARLELQGEVAEDEISNHLLLYDSAQKVKYHLIGELHSVGDQQLLKLHENQILMYENWSVPKDNSFKFSSDGFVAHHFNMKQGNQRIELNSSSDEDNILSVSINELKLATLSSLVSNDTLLNGVLDGNIQLYSKRAKGSMEALLTIDNLTFRQTNFGDLDLQINRKGTDLYQVAIGMVGPDTKLDMNGHYAVQKNDIDLNIDISSFDLAIAEALSFGSLKEAKGNLSGNFALSGNLDSPSLAGKIQFKNAEMTSTYLGSKLFLKNERITIDPRAIRFADFEIRDQKENTLKINGAVHLKSLLPTRLDLTLVANNFQLLNTTQGDNELFYGKVFINTQTKISGTLSQPTLNMHINLREGSDFTYVVPQSESGVMERKGIVKFVDPDAQKDPFLASIKRDIRTPVDSISFFKGMVLDANIELDDGEIFHIVLDPITGDKLTIQGNSNITFDIDETGDMNLAGRYEITKGIYNLSLYKLVKREFQIEQGSSITWSGDLLNATLDITSQYRVETAPIDLVSNQLTTTSMSERNRYKQRLPFFVNLDLDGNLLSPEISFELDMPVRYRNAFGGNIYARIRDINTRPSELNKQVFSLILLKRFMSENIFDSEGGASLNSTARRSASQVLSEQLNRLSENIKGVELSFDLDSYEDFSKGEAENKTQLELGLSKQFLDDRLVIKLSGNLNIEGDPNAQRTVSDYIGDLALEYKLTEDGQLRVTGFRNSDYNMIDGELKETGVGIIYLKDYNSFKELFMSSKKHE